MIDVSKRAEYDTMFPVGTIRQSINPNEEKFLGLRWKKLEGGCFLKSVDDIEDVDKIKGEEFPIEVPLHFHKYLNNFFAEQSQSDDHSISISLASYISPLSKSLISNSINNSLYAYLFSKNSNNNYVDGNKDRYFCYSAGATTIGSAYSDHDNSYVFGSLYNTLAQINSKEELIGATNKDYEQNEDGSYNYTSKKIPEPKNFGVFTYIRISGFADE